MLQQHMLTRDGKLRHPRSRRMENSQTLARTVEAGGSSFEHLVLWWISGGMTQISSAGVAANVAANLYLAKKYMTYCLRLSFVLIHYERCDFLLQIPNL